MIIVRRISDRITVLMILRTKLNINAVIQCTQKKVQSAIGNERRKKEVIELMINGAMVSVILESYTRTLQVLKLVQRLVIPKHLIAVMLQYIKRRVIVLNSKLDTICSFRHTFWHYCSFFLCVHMQYMQHSIYKKKITLSILIVFLALPRALSFAFSRNGTKKNIKYNTHTSRKTFKVRYKRDLKMHVSAFDEEKKFTSYLDTLNYSVV